MVLEQGFRRCFEGGLWRRQPSPPLPSPPPPPLTASLQAFNNSALKRKKMDVYTTCSRSDSIVTQRTLLRKVMGFCTFFCCSIEMLSLNAPFLRLILWWKWNVLSLTFYMFVLFVAIFAYCLGFWILQQFELDSGKWSWGFGPNFQRGWRIIWPGNHCMVLCFALYRIVRCRNVLEECIHALRLLYMCSIKRCGEEPLGY